MTDNMTLTHHFENTFYFFTFFRQIQFSCWSRTPFLQGVHLRHPRGGPRSVRTVRTVRTERTVPYRAVPCRTVPHRTVPYRTEPSPHRTVPYRTAPCRTVQHRTAKANVSNRNALWTEARGLSTGVFCDCFTVLLKNGLRVDMWTAGRLLI